MEKATETNTKLITDLNHDPMFPEYYPIRIDVFARKSTAALEPIRVLAPKEQDVKVSNDSRQKLLECRSSEIDDRSVADSQTPYRFVRWQRCSSIDTDGAKPKLPQYTEPSGRLQ